jgi:glutamine synthetase
MSTLQLVAQKYGMTCLLHEKPFAGINGSGKHLNWSLGTTKANLLEPGDTPHANAQFLVFCSAVIRAVHKYSALLRTTVAHSSNDHRLGANEAPPAIISIYLGDMLTDVFLQIAKGGVKKAKNSGFLQMGVDTLPPLPKDAGDRNRTSPFAFTGNKFEFRAVGSSQSVAWPLAVLNTIIAESIDFVATELEKATGGKPEKLNDAAQKIVAQVVKDHGAVIFNGDNYSEAWHKEAEKRGLPNLRNTVDAIPSIIHPDSIAVMEKFKVLSRREMQARYEIYLERYVKDVAVEGRLALEIAKTMIFPAAVKYQRDLASTALAMKELGKDCCTSVLDELNGHVAALQDAMVKLDHAISHTDKNGTTLDHARHSRDEILPAMNKVRAIADAIEGIVSDEYWPLPTYQEMLFIK